MTTLRSIDLHRIPLDISAIECGMNIYRGYSTNKIKSRQLQSTQIPIDTLDEAVDCIEIFSGERLKDVHVMLIGFDFIIQEDVFIVVGTGDSKETLIAGFINNMIQ